MGDSCPSVPGTEGVQRLWVLKPQVSRAKGDGSCPGGHACWAEIASSTPNTFFFHMVSCFCPARDISHSPLWPGVATWLVLIKGCHASQSDSEAGASLLASLSPGCWHLSSLGKAMHCKWRSHCGPGLVADCEEHKPLQFAEKKKKRLHLGVLRKVFGNSLTSPTTCEPIRPQIRISDLTFRTFELSPEMGMCQNPWPAGEMKTNQKPTPSNYRR